TQANLAGLAMAKAQLEVRVDGEDPGDDVVWLLAANPGAPPAPLARAASGGELARAMLALRLTLLGVGPDGVDPAAPETLIFDEVDAGIGGAAAISVGRALARLGAGRQVLVVTHLPQVAAWADAQVAVAKRDDGASTVSEALRLAPEARVVELSRMLSGSPESASARAHAEELLAEAAAARAAARAPARSGRRR
ncbi:MAG: DNA repair protein RecN, partial [Acidimicrobiales bacterium]